VFYELPNNTWKVRDLSVFLLFAVGRVHSPSIPERQKASIDMTRSATGFLATKSKNVGIFGLVAWTIGAV
jgi:hypothetical protein